MIREVAESDARDVAEIYNHYIENSLATFEEVKITANEIRRRIHKVANSALPWLVAIDNQKVIGYAYASKWNERAAYRYTAEISVYLSHDITLRGWGTKLYQVLFEHLRQKDMRVVIGGITLPNPSSVALHEKFGMKKVAHFNQVGFKFNQWLDVGYWQGKLR